MKDRIRLGGNAAKLHGQRFNRLTVSHAVGRNKHNHIVWLCICDCGNETKVTTQSLTSNNTKSCGCAKADHAKDVQHLAAEARVVHGVSGTPEYYAWWHARARCTDENHQSYRYYGARGIRMCRKWRDSVAAFVEDMGLRPDGLSLDRINNDGDYEPGNCRWATLEQQMLNKRQRGKSNESTR
jgi:hypothetical protein